MIEDILLIKIKNGWILTIRDKGMMRDHNEDIYMKNRDEIVKWFQENIGNGSN